MDVPRTDRHGVRQGRQTHRHPFHRPGPRPLAHRPQPECRPFADGELPADPSGRARAGQPDRARHRCRSRRRLFEMPGEETGRSLSLRRGTGRRSGEVSRRPADDRQAAHAPAKVGPLDGAPSGDRHRDRCHQLGADPGSDGRQRTDHALQAPRCAGGRRTRG